MQTGGWLEHLAGHAWCDKDTGSLELSGNRHLDLSHVWLAQRSGTGAFMQTHVCLRLLCVYEQCHVQALAECSLCNVGLVG